MKLPEHQGMLDLQYLLEAIPVGASSPVFTGLREPDPGSRSLFDTYLPVNQTYKLRDDIRVRPTHYSEEQKLLVQKLLAGERDQPEGALSELLFRYLDRSEPAPRPQPKAKRPEPSHEDPGLQASFESQAYGPMITIV